MAARKKNLNSREFAALSAEEQAKYEGNKPEKNQYLNKAYRDSAKKQHDDGTVTKFPLLFSERETFGQKLIVQPSYDSNGNLVTVIPQSGFNKDKECVWLTIMQDKSMENLKTIDRKVDLGQMKSPITSPHFTTQNEARVVNGKVQYFENHSAMYPKEEFDAIVEAAGDNHCYIDEYVAGQNKEGENYSRGVNGEVYGIYAPCRAVSSKDSRGVNYYKLVATNRRGESELKESNNMLTPEKFQNQMDYVNKVKQNLIDLKVKQKDLAVTPKAKASTKDTSYSVSTPAMEDVKEGQVEEFDAIEAPY